MQYRPPRKSDLSEALDLWRKQPFEPQRSFQMILAAAARWDEFPTDEDVEVAMVAMANTKAGFDPPHFGMDELARAALAAVRARCADTADVERL